MNLEKELMNFEFRTADVQSIDIFPNVDVTSVRNGFAQFRNTNQHQTIFNVMREMWNEGYNFVFNNFSFWEHGNEKFRGHCHQCTPALGLVLGALQFPVSYLECFRIQDSFLNDGLIKKISPTEEPNPAMRDEFITIKRIPYCCLEVAVGEDKFYITGKHLKPEKNKANALLTPECYRQRVGVFPHQDDEGKSGIYLETFTPSQNPDLIDFSDRIVWKKQTERDPQPELFATYLRMNLKI